jgi:hypothetical protein
MMSDIDIGEARADVHSDVHGTDPEDYPDEHPRERKMTQKGLEYVLHIKRKNLDTLCRGLEKHMDILQELTADHDENVDTEVDANYKRWVMLFDELLYVDKEYMKLLGKDESTEYMENWRTARLLTFRDFKHTMEQWFAVRAKEKTRKKRPPGDKIPHSKDPDNISVVTDTSMKSRSSRSSRSSRHSVISARLEQEQKKAELAVKEASMKKRRQLEEAKLHLRLQEEEMKLEEEIAISNAKGKVLDDLDAKSIISHHTSTSSDSSAALMSIVRHLRKPATELKTFGGNPLEYHRFLRQFKIIVLSNCDDFDEKLNYLEQFTTGEANKIVVGFSYLDAEKGYNAALREFEDRYGDVDIVVNAFVKKALSWPTIKHDNPKALDEFAIFLAECEHAVHNLEALNVLEYTDNFKRIVGKLPFAMHDRWRSIAHDKKEHGQKVKFSHLVKFVQREARKINDPTFGREAMSCDLQQKHPQQDSRGHRTKGTFATKLTEVKDDPSTHVNRINKSSIMPRNISDNKYEVSKGNAFSTPCTYCKGTHSLEFCRRLIILPYYDRMDVLKSKGYCFGCLRIGHQRQICKNKATCRECGCRHPSVLHVDGRIPTREELLKSQSSEVHKVHTTASVSACADMANEVNCSSGAGDVECTLAIIPVKVNMSGSSTVISTYAFLDPGSNVSFCAENLMHQLGGEGRRMKLTMDTMGVPHTMNTYAFRGLEISDLSQENTIKLPTLYTKDRMPVSTIHIPTSDDIHKWPHLREINLPQINSEVGILIGNNVPDAYTPLEFKIGPPGTPYASRTRLGWIPWNVSRTGQADHIVVNRADVIAIERVQDLRDLNTLYMKSVNLDFPERITEDKPENSQEDKLFLEKVTKSIRVVNDHYEFCLPFRNQFPALPNNQTLALQRLKSLHKKLTLNPQFHEEYRQFMAILLEKGYAEEVPMDELDRSDGKTWYLPHHGVYHPKKQKLRIVFDCSAKYRGVSLNDVLLQGPDLTTSLVSVLLKFRQEPVAVMADIEKMFYQVNVSRDDRDCLRFYWWPDGNIESTPTVCRMTVHLFGAISSPSCSTFALQQTVHANRDKFDSMIGDVALNNFYVDDLLCSLPTDEMAIQVVKEVTSLCKKGGFRLTKWVSNSRDVLKNIEVQDRAKGLTELDFDKFPTERALGVLWNVETDNIEFRITPKCCEATRRNILSIVSSVYDPLGIVSPFILPAKILMQDLCRRGMDWDTTLSGSDLYQWQQWSENLPGLESLSFQRCLKPSNFEDLPGSSIELHYFSDASELGYGIVSYIRFIDSTDKIHCSLLYGKSRVAPLKKITIPRMELTAATLAVKTHRMLSAQIDYQVDKVFFWTDSML